MQLAVRTIKSLAVVEISSALQMGVTKCRAQAKPVPMVTVWPAFHSSLYGEGRKRMYEIFTTGTKGLEGC